MHNSVVLLHSQGCGTIPTIWFQNLFNPSQRNPIPLAVPPPSSVPPTPAAAHLLSGHFIQIESHTMWPCVSGSSPSASRRPDPSVLSCVAYQHLIFSYAWTHHILTVHSQLDGHLRCVYIFVVVNNAAVNTCGQVSVLKICLKILSIYLGMGFLGQVVILCLTF